MIALHSCLRLLVTLIGTGLVASCGYLRLDRITGAEAAQCNDGVRGGDESDIDCGGSCGPCAVSAHCSANNDCQSALCAGAVCVAALAATCSNGTQDGDESDTDCGGSLCNPCDNGQACAVAGDCGSGTCSNPSSDALALYRFSAGSGTRVFDRAGLSPALDVDFLAQDYSWSSNGLTTQNPAAVLGMTQPAGQDASHVVDAIMNSSAFSVEAWITPEQAEQLSASPSFIAAIVPATGTDTASIILGQGGNDGPTSWRGSRFGAGFREAGIGFHWLWTHTGAATTNLTHLVVTYRVENDGFKLYVNGSMIRSNSAPSLGLQSSHRINLGHYWTADSSRRWHGTHHQVAFYSRALDAGEIAAHFAAGYGGGRCL